MKRLVMAILVVAMSSCGLPPLESRSVPVVAGSPYRAARYHGKSLVVAERQTTVNMGVYIYSIDRRKR